MRRLALMLVCVLMAAAAVTTAQPQESRDLEIDADGSAEDVDDGSSHDLTVNVSGTVTVTESEDGQDETAFATPGNVTANVTVDDTTYTVPVTVGGEGTSFEQAGLVDGEAWRLHLQGESFQDNRENRDGSGASLSTNVTLRGANGDFLAFGDGWLTVQDQQDTTTFDLDYRGTASFE